MTHPATPPATPGAADAMTNAVLDFRPSRNAFHFPNRFEPGRAQRLLEPKTTVMGLCGGMSFVVRDLFDRHLDPPSDTEPPRRGSRSYSALFRRQVQSFDWLRLPFRFWRLSALHPEPPTWWSRLLRARRLGDIVRDEEWPAIRAEIDAGRLAHVGALRFLSADPRKLTLNHQVLAYAYRAEPDAVTIRIYDPNWPDRDDVELLMDLSDAAAPRFSQSTGEALYAFFHARYTAADPRGWSTA
jgi:hypothetical protein